MNANLKRFRKYLKPDPASGCWLWTGCLCKGYGNFSLNGTAHYAHRWLWEYVNGPVPAGLELDHLCGVKNCVNPAHLEAVTHAENMRRAAMRGVWDGERNGAAKRTTIEVLTIKFLNRYLMLPATMISRAMKIPQRSVYSVLRGEVWNHTLLPSREELQREFEEAAAA